MARSSLRVTDFHDREFLALCIDAMDGDGWWDSAEVVKAPELKGLERKHVAQRCSWLWRYGVLEREHLADEHGNLRYVADDPGRPKWGQRWRLTPIGENVLMGAMTKGQRSTVEGMAPERMLELTRLFSQMLRDAPDVARNMMLREWRYQTQDVRATVLEVERRR